MAICLSIPAYAAVSVSPTKIEINANKVKNNYVTTAVEVKGDATQPMRFKAYAGYFEVKENGELNIIDDSNAPENIASKLRFVPSEFTVPPGKSQKLRVNVANLKTLPEGESRAIIFIEDINVKEINLEQRTSGHGAQIILKSRIGIPVYVDKGKFTKRADVENFELTSDAKGLYAKMNIVSSGNSKIRYTGNVQIFNGKKIVDEFNLDGGVVPPKSTHVLQQKISTSKITEAGSYTVRVIISYLDENGNKKNIKQEKVLQLKGEKV